MKRFFHKATGSVFKRKPRKKRTLRMDTPDAPAPGGVNTSLPQEGHRPRPPTNEATPNITQHEIDPTANCSCEAGSPSGVIEGNDPPSPDAPREDLHSIVPIQDNTAIAISQVDNSVMDSYPLEVRSLTSNIDTSSDPAAPHPKEEVPPTKHEDEGPSFFEKVVDPFLYCLDVAEKALDIPGIPLAKSVVGIVSQTVKQVKDMRGNRKEFSDLADELRNLSGKISEGLDKDASKSSGEFRQALEMAIKELLTPMTSFCADIKDRQSHGTLRAYFEAGKDKEDLTQLKQKVDTAKQNFQVGSLIRIERDLIEQRKDRHLARVDTIHRAKIASWNSHRSNAPVSCFEGTREGVLRKITEWIDSDDPASPRVFWLNGMAGIGKSTIARTIAERAYEHRILGGSFFFSRNDHDLSNIGLLFPTLAHQLAYHHVTYLSSIAAALEREGDLGHKDVTTQFKNLFLDPITGSTHKPTVLLLVLDALDEASPENDVRRVLELLLSVRVGFALKVFLTSRPEAHIRLVFDNDRYHSCFVLHDIKKSVVEGDIRRFLEYKLSTLPKQLGISLTDWPSVSDLDTLVAKSGQLFVFAATVVRFVADDRIRDPQGRLARFINTQAALGPSVYKQVDQVYLLVLQGAVAGVDDDEYINRLRTTLAAIVLLRNPVPLTALAALLGYDPNQVLRSFDHLHSIIIVPSRIQDTPKIYHQSFPDFIKDFSRCTDENFYVDVQSQETSLLLQCLETMMKSLHYNMGSFNTASYTANRFDWRGHPIIEPMSNRDISHDALISPELEYACQFWYSHLLKIVTPTSEILEQLEVFTFEYILFWVETMSLLGLVESARVAMRDAHQWASKSDCKKDLIDILYDGYRLIWLYQSHISIFAMNIYLIAFPLIPQSTCLFTTYKNKEYTTQRLYPKSLTWSPMLSSGTVSYQKFLWSVAYAPDGQYIATGSHQGSIDLWDTLSGAHIRQFETIFPKAIYKIYFLSNSQYLVSMSHSKNLADISVTLEQLATASDDTSVKIWDIKTVQCQSTLQHSDKVNSVWLDSKEDRLLLQSSMNEIVFSPDSKQLISGKLAPS
ncbi:hypothetical protein NLI96_g10464 [Meripilus lineatus]|uniref:NACHT domain-containing protein n=1 Tax=Meripilus lineatus TaxID=2056292 RepID=A0AAD5UVZ6_9APHY|nr:hypothetical protein NLI96_g10464 [Physisporinus lineatus]